MPAQAPTEPPRAAGRHVYTRLQQALGGEDARPAIVARYVEPEAGQRVLDLGCGPGTILEVLPEVEYVGIDNDATRIEAGRRQFGDRAEFVCTDAADERLLEGRAFDRVLAFGVIHHLDDEAAARMLTLAARVLAPGGRFVAVDGVREPRQNPLARLALALDRGRHVRAEPAYRALSERFFEDVRFDVRHDILRVPYSHLIQVCERPRAAATSA